jgi:hypothetical protein
VKRNGCRREAGSEGSVEQGCEPMNKKPDTRRQRRTSGQRIAKSISIKGAKRRSGGCAPKAIELTPGDLLRVASKATEEAERPPDREAEVSRGHSRSSCRRG